MTRLSEIIEDLDRYNEWEERMFAFHTDRISELIYENDGLKNVLVPYLPEDWDPTKFSPLDEFDENFLDGFSVGFSVTVNGLEVTLTPRLYDALITCRNRSRRGSDLCQVYQVVGPVKTLVWSVDNREVQDADV